MFMSLYTLSSHALLHRMKRKSYYLTRLFIWHLGRVNITEISSIKVVISGVNRENMKIHILYLFMKKAAKTAHLWRSLFYA